ncbi:MAG: pentapeptide repeat-containing protein [Anaerolineaceae bacterium]|nr:MAG: pentapeptide repeat-containing protein [Anaerolineaceae bacterium]
MEKHLDKKGIRFWRDIHDATAGRLEKVIDTAIRQNPTVLLVLSKDSVQSDWVEHEARSARELEKELKRDMLCPVALDGAWKDCDWEARLREQIMKYNILDFSNWKDEAEFTRKFAKLVEGLDLFYKE